jgi:glycosyltransferase involved in cell wall biosynthesis
MKKFFPIKIEKKYDIIHIGALARVKHLEVLLEIVRILKKRKKQIKVGLAGPGPLREELEIISKQLGLEKNIEFLGFVDDATNFINSGKVYVLTSESEGFPTAMIEAMSCGIPSVVSNVGNIKDVAVNGENCFLIDDYRDVDSYVKVISKLLKDEKLYNKISKNALEVRNTYSVSNATNVWKKIFRKLQLS